MEPRLFSTVHVYTPSSSWPISSIVRDMFTLLFVILIWVECNNCLLYSHWMDGVGVPSTWWQNEMISIALTTRLSGNSDKFTRNCQGKEEDDSYHEWNNTHLYLVSQFHTAAQQKHDWFPQQCCWTVHQIITDKQSICSMYSSLHATSFVLWRFSIGTSLV